MKRIFLLIFFGLITLTSFSQNRIKKTMHRDTTTKTQIVEASCGECKFKMGGKGCHLAIRIKGRSYFVDRAGIDDHGDAHAQDGLCKAVRKAEVRGKIVNNRFKATYFKLLKEEEKS